MTLNVGSINQDALNTQPLNQGKFYGVGVGPGDPELLTLKAYRLIKQAKVISYLSGKSGSSQAKNIAKLAIQDRSDTEADIVIMMPMLEDRTMANTAYDQGALKIRERLEQGHDVVFLCEGDPLFFGSFSYLMSRLQEDFTCHVVPGISSVNAAAATLSTPLTMLKESFVVVSGRHTDAQIEQALMTHDSVVIMKAGLARTRILDLLKATGRSQDARYLEYIGRDNQKIIEDVKNLSHEAGPYFSLFVVLPSNRREK